MAQVTIEIPGQETKQVELVGSHTIGRHPSQDLQVMDRLVSKAHCRIFLSAHGWMIEDTGSRNGTIVNNRKTEGAVRLNNGDRIMVGASRLTFEVSERVVQPEVDLTDPGMAPVVQTVMDASDAMEFAPANLIDDVEQLKADYEKLRFAYQLHRAVAQEWDLQPMLDRIQDMLFSFMPAVDRTMILLRHRRTGELYPAARQYRPGLKETGKISISRAIIETVIADRKAMMTNDAIMDSRFDGSQSVMLQGIRSAIAVPLLGYERDVLGVLHVDSLRRIGAFTERDVGVLQGLANQAALNIENAYFAEKIKEDAAQREKFQRFLSPNLVSKVLGGELDFEKGGEERLVTVMFTDIRQFTSLSERHSAPVIVDLLNHYFERMAEIVFDYDGTLDKFMGDGLMALWGAPITGSADAANAVHAAIRMQQAMKEFNVTAEGIINEHIQIGVGIDCGRVVAGLMGSSRTMNYTVIGSCANRSARLCSAAKPGEVLVSDSIFQAMGPSIPCCPMGTLVLKGFAAEVPVFKLLFDA